MENKVTVDTILGKLQEWVENKTPIDAATWLDAAMKLTILISDTQHELFLIEQALAQKKLNCMDTYHDSAAKAKIRCEASDEYVQAKKLEAKIEQVTELVRISKVQARMSDENLKNYR